MKASLNKMKIVRWKKRAKIKHDQILVAYCARKRLINATIKISRSYNLGMCKGVNFYTILSCRPPNFKNKN